MREEFDPKTCVTAKELRDGGLQLPLEIPDAAWVPKLAVHYDMKNAQTTFVPEANRIDSVIPVHINVEFNPPDVRSIAKVTICEVPRCGAESPK